jgi:hypothetical protein
LEEYFKLKILLEGKNAPVAVKLFRSPSAPLILYFLRKLFKEKPAASVPHVDVVRQLTEVLEQINRNDYAEEDDEVLNTTVDSAEKAELLIRKWSDRGYLTFEPDDKGQFQHSLTSDTEKVLGWLDSLRKDTFISTESKFIDIFNKLREISENNTDDWKERVETLKAKKRSLEAEIRKLEIEQTVIMAEDYYVESRFNEVSKLAHSLMADFREVEENFTTIKNSIYEKQTNLELSKGNILNYTLDALDEIRNTYQGKSFEAFYRHLLDDSSKDELTGLIQNVYSIMQQRNIEVNDPFLLKLRIYLNNEGTRVRNSYHRLADKLNKVLSEKSMLERKAAIRLMSEIKTLALQAKDNPPRDEQFMEVEGLPVIELTVERPLNLEEQDGFALAAALQTADVDLTGMDLGNLVNQFFVDKEALEHNIGELLKKQKQATLKDVVEQYPITKGISEILTYVNIATQSNKCFINRDKQELIVIGEKGKRAIKLPEIIYTK